MHDGRASADDDARTWRRSYGWRWFSRAFHDAFGHLTPTIAGVFGPAIVMLVVSLVSSDADDRVDALTQLRWLGLGLLGSGIIAALWFSFRLILTPSLLEREARASERTRTDELTSRLQSARAQIVELQAQLSALPVLNLAVRAEPDRLSSVDDDETRREAWLQREREAYAHALARLKPARFPEIAALDRDRRRPEEYDQEVSDYLGELRRQWPTVLAAGAMSSGQAAFRIVVRNKAANFAEVQLRLTIPADVIPHWDSEWPQLPQAPLLYGQDSVLRSIRSNPAFAIGAPRVRGIIDTSGEPVVEFPPVELHAGGHARLDPVVLAIPGRYAGTRIAIGWTAAARGIREPQIGTLMLEVKGEPQEVEQALQAVSVR